MIKIDVDCNNPKGLSLDIIEKELSDYFHTYENDIVLEI